MHLGISLLTLVPGRMGGSESYVRALLDQFARGNGPERVTVLANREVLSAYADLARGPVSLNPVSEYHPGHPPAARAAAMLAAHAVPRRLARYRAARALVFPSLYEGFGGPPLEAMACRCPVASSTRASLAEVAGGASVELDPESTESIAAAIERVVDDGPLGQELVATGLERAKQYSWPEAARRHATVYRRAQEASG